MTKKNSKKILFIVTGIATIIGLYLLFIVFSASIFSNNKTEKINFAIPTNSTVEDIGSKLEKELTVKHFSGFYLIAKVLDLQNHIYPGMYELYDGMSNWDVVRLFRSGHKQTIDFTIKFARHSNDVLKLASEKLEANYSELVSLTNNRQFMDSLGFNKANTICLFIPDTYDFYWNTSARKFLERMAKEYNNFWNDKRKEQARKAGMTPQEVMTLASIVNQETTRNEDKPKIAGVYVNRLKNKAMGKLQADPTIKFALNNFEIKRIKKGHIERAKISPYSTYENKGLPPGPICTPQKTDIDAVLNYKHHNYYYFCAQPNYSGYSNFATTYDQHRKFATEYQKWLTKEGF